jgi:hypothetical protein
MASRLVVALLLLALSTACGTTRMVFLDTGQGASLEYRPPTSNRSVEVDEDEFKEALARLVLEAPLFIRSSQQGWLVRTSAPINDADSSRQYLLRKSFGGPCRPHQNKENCLSLLDVVGLSQTDKLAVALGLSFEPMRQSIAKAVEGTLSPQLFVAAIGAGMVTWVVLAANPEPVFTKAAAIVAAVMVSYLGVDAFLEVVNACFELKRASDAAVTFEELAEAGERFGRVMGTQGARVFILAVTVLVSRGTMGGASWLAAGLPLLPRFAEASAMGASQVGIGLETVGQVSAVAVVEGKLIISLAPTALAMMAGNSGAERAGGTETTVNASNYRETFFAAHPALRDKVIVHHAVEQQVLKRYPGLFTEAEIHSLKNLRGIPKSISPDLHLSKIRRAWNQFYRTHPSPTKQDLLGFSAQLDRQFGAIFEPPL